MGVFLMEDLNSLNKRAHKISMSNRRNLMISGVVDVLSFDVREVLLETELGMLMIKGADLHISRLTLDKGEVDVEGKVDSLTYSEQDSFAKKSESFLGKLFK